MRQTGTVDRKWEYIKVPSQQRKNNAVLANKKCHWFHTWRLHKSRHTASLSAPQWGQCKDMWPSIYGYKNPKRPFPFSPHQDWSQCMESISTIPPYPTPFYPTSPPEPEPFPTALQVCFLQVKNIALSFFVSSLICSHKARGLTGTFRNNVGYIKDGEGPGHRLQSSEFSLE